MLKNLYLPIPKHLNMRLHLFCISIILFSYTSLIAQSPYNLDMEVKDDSTYLPKGWSAFSDKKVYSFKLDSSVKYQGKYSFLIESFDSAYNMNALSIYSIEHANR